MSHPNYLARSRKPFDLSQEDVANLAGVSRPLISRIENGEETPSLRVALALQVIFGPPPPNLFRSLYDETMDAVLRRAAAMEEAIRADASSKADLKRQFLCDLVARNNPLPA